MSHTGEDRRAAQHVEEARRRILTDGESRTAADPSERSPELVVLGLTPPPHRVDSRGNVSKQQAFLKIWNSKTISIIKKEEIREIV